MPQPHWVDLIYNTLWPEELENLSHKDNFPPSVVPLNTPAATGHTSKDSFQSWDQEFICDSKVVSGCSERAATQHHTHSSPADSQAAGDIPSKLEK